MKPNGRLGLVVLLPVAMAATACGDSLTEVNENPNAPKDVGPEFIIPTAIRSAAFELLGDDGLDVGTSSLWAQHLARLQYGATDRYDLDVDFSDGSWGDLWLDVLGASQEVIDRSDAAGAPNMAATGWILRSWVFQHMTDLWGDLPYTQALKGDAEGEEASTTPPYDTQHDLYYALFEDLKAAVDMIDPDGETFDAEDLLYGGDMEKWRKFANSLRLRLAVHLSEVDPDKAATEAAAAVAAGVFTSNADDAKLVYAATAPNQNPMHVGFSERPGDYRVSATLIDALEQLGDPRLGIYADPAEDTGEYTGMPNGMPDNHGIGFANVSKLGEWFLRPETPAVFLSYAEVLLLQAEAAERGWIAGDPAQLYEAAITASLELYGISSGDIATYLAQPEVAYDPARGLEQIALQKWIVLFDQGVEAYTEWRRTGVPSLVAGPANTNGDLIPVRLPYPVEEQAINRSNLQAASERQGGATINDPVWWDVR